MARLAEYQSLRFSAGGHPVTRVFSQRLGAIAAWLAERTGATPNHVTLLGAALFAAGAALFAAGPATWGVALACLLVFQLAYVVDCADGQLARATGRAGAFGAWLDMACDYVRNVLVGAALSAWLLRQGLGSGTAFAAGAVFTAGAAVQLHTVTHLRRSESARLQARGALQALRTLVTALLDSPSVLLLLAVLRPWPAPLAAFAIAVGTSYLAMAVFQARRRLSP